MLVAAVLMSAGLVSHPGCKRSGLGRDNQNPRGATAKALKARANKLWQAKVDEDCKTVFEFEVTRDQEGVTEDDFCNYFKTEEPFRVLKCQVGEIEIDDRMGWVELDVTTSMRRFPTASPVDAKRWERWHFINDKWMPVPSTVLDAYPDAPAVRDLPAEAELRKRFDESWQARLDRDWDHLYEFIDPRDRDQVDPHSFAATHELFEYLSCEVHWIEVKGDAGIVRVTVHHKINDPSLSKLDPRDATVREEWVRYDGQWYLDIKREA